MEIRAISKNTGIPPRKARLLVDMVRGKQVEQALDMLKFMPSPSAKVVSKVIQSAAECRECFSDLVFGLENRENIRR